jgi:hypothetical protein
MSETQDIDNLKLLGLNTVNNIYMQVMVMANHRRLQPTCVSWILKRRNGWTCIFENDYANSGGSGYGSALTKGIQLTIAPSQANVTFDMVVNNPPDHGTMSTSNIASWILMISNRTIVIIIAPSFIAIPTALLTAANVLEGYKTDTSEGRRVVGA